MNDSILLLLRVDQQLQRLPVLLHITLQPQKAWYTPNRAHICLGMRTLSERLERHRSRALLAICRTLGNHNTYHFEPICDVLLEDEDFAAFKCAPAPIPRHPREAKARETKRQNGISTTATTAESHVAHGHGSSLA